MKNVITNSSIYTVTSILQKAIGFFLLPIYTIYLTPEDYGITGVVNALTALLSLLFTLSLNSSVQRYYYIYDDRPVERQYFFGTIILTVLANSLFLGFLLIIFKDILILPFVNNIQFYPYIFIGILTIIVNPIYTIYQTLLQTMEMAKDFALNSLLNFISLISLNLIFIIVFRLGATGQLLSYLIVGLIFGLYSLYSLVKKRIIKIGFSIEYLREGLSYSIPLLPHLLSTNIANLVSRLFLNNQVSTSGVGLFNLSSQIMLIIDTLQMSVNSAYIPWFYGLMNKGREEHYQVIKFADIICRGYLFISLGVLFFAKEVIILFTADAYHLAWTIVPIMLIAYQIRSIYLFFINTLFYNTRGSRFIFFASLSGSLLNIIVSAKYTETFGIQTPAIAILIQNLFMAGLAIYMSNKIEPVAFGLKKMVSYVLLLIVISLGIYHLDSQAMLSINWSWTFIKLILIIAIFPCLFYSDIKQMVSNYRGK
ncbi:hypothetical protein AWM75_07790 [Aerococcus urinaehominis]|uniref:Uncharacterized protein n=1 Tax=Aerococcus urinaehominis TaxID=128944 RepID=A0A0X8FM63_9LACT|nr:oligosaccharide flippase family protein [Aerococcus urinaehominis]AMB99873.1 hypothetical protein AWM75_07790 [Aerococcus urinaehominis]SDM54518.1 Membrane protein involved in the export of O-antigen and teichoic acid [Aerococcus urinaehominis]